MFLVTVEIKDHAICTLTPSQGDPIIVKAPKEMFSTSTKAIKPNKISQNSRPLIGYKKMKRKKTKKWTKKITSP